MRKSLLVLIAVGAVVAITLFSGRGCARATDQEVAAVSTPPARSGADGAMTDGPTATEAAAVIAARRHADMQEAVSALHRYLAALGSGDSHASASFWSGGVVPRASGEADLRSRGPLRSLRSKTGIPTPLDASPVPDALEIPVELRAAADGSPLLLYAGHYRLRRRVVDGGWEITSAAVVARSP